MLAEVLQPITVELYLIINTLQCLADTSHQTYNMAESLLSKLEAAMSSATPSANSTFNDSSTSVNLSFS